MENAQAETVKISLPDPRVEVNEDSYARGRNGVRDIQAVVLSPLFRFQRVMVDVITRARGVRMNAGFSIGIEDMDELCRQWIRYRKHMGCWTSVSREEAGDAGQ